jgi:hypothetical protein
MDSLGPGIITGKMDKMDSDPFAVNPGGVRLQGWSRGRWDRRGEHLTRGR